MSLVTGQAVPDRRGAVLEDERAAFLYVARQAGDLAGLRHLEVLASRESVGLMTGRTLHPSAAQAVRKGFVPEGSGLRRVTGAAQGRLRPGEQMRRMRLGSV
ncbi:MAG: hypothetical protein ABIO78_05990, partial [Thermoanaerobaculia bacterium]